MSHDEDDELEFDTRSNGRIGKLYIIKVLKEYGFFYAAMLLVFALCYFLVIIPGTAVYLFKGLVALITFLSNGNDALYATYWSILVGGLVIAIASWITDKVLDKKYSRNSSRKNSEI